MGNTNLDLHVQPRLHKVSSLDNGRRIKHVNIACELNARFQPLLRRQRQIINASKSRLSLRAERAKSQQSMTTLVNHLTASPPQIAHAALEKSELTGDVGKLKNSMLSRLKHSFFSYWNSDPRTDEKRTKAADAACDYLELGANVVSSIPGYEQVVEILSLAKQLLSVRSKRGY
jgi:hypothetical protein